MLVEFLLHHAFLACATALLGGATIYLWTQGSAKVALEATAAVMRINQDNALVIDLRPRADYDKGHVPGAMQVNLSEIEAKAAGLAKKRPLILIDANGMGATGTARKLAASGIDASSLKGGMRSWLEAGQPVHRKKKKK